MQAMRASAEKVSVGRWVAGAPDDEAPVAPPGDEASSPRGVVGLVVFLVGLAVALVGAAVASLTAVVLAGLGAWLLWSLPSAPLPPPLEAVGPEIEFITVPETRPEALPTRAPAARQPAQREAPAKPVRAHEAPAPIPAAAPPVPAPAPAPPTPVEAKGNAAKISLESVPLDEAIQRVNGKAGRGEARRSAGQ